MHVLVLRSTSHEASSISISSSCKQDSAQILPWGLHLPRLLLLMFVVLRVLAAHRDKMNGRSPVMATSASW